MKKMDVRNINEKLFSSDAKIFKTFQRCVLGVAVYFDRLFSLKLREIYPISIAVIVFLTSLTIITSLILLSRHSNNLKLVSLREVNEYEYEYYMESSVVAAVSTAPYISQSIEQQVAPSAVTTTLPLDYYNIRLRNMKQRQLLQQHGTSHTDSVTFGPTDSVTFGPTDSITFGPTTTFPPAPSTTLPFDLVDNHWLAVHGDIRTHQIYLYSAWYDNRNVTIYDHPVIRVTSICSTTLLHKKFKCIYYFDDSMSEINADDVVPLADSNLKSNQSMSAIVVVCPVLNKTIPKGLSIHVKRGPRNQTSIPVQIPMKKKRYHQMTICTMVDWRFDDEFGRSDNIPYPYVVLDWITMQKILGANKVIVYLTQSIRKHLELKSFLYQIALRYVRFIELRFYDNISELDQEKNKKAYFSALANDCLNSLIYKSNYVSFLTFEDIIFPKQEKRLLETIKDIDNIDDFDSFLFRSHYFLRNYPPRFSSTPYSTILRHLTKIPNNTSAFKSATDLRSIVNTKSCLVVDFHKCLISSHSKSVVNNYLVNESIAYSHNYQNCHSNHWNCKLVLKSFEYDQSALIFEKTFLIAFRKNILKYFQHNL